MAWVTILLHLKRTKALLVRFGLDVNFAVGSALVTVVVVVVDGVAVAYFERTHLESFVFTNLRSIY